jgi:CHAD domain-containing protein
MGGKLKANENLPRGVQRVVEWQMKQVLADLSGSRGSRRGESIHAARKGIKRVRATLRLLQGTLGPSDWRKLDLLLRNAGRALGEWRDAEVVIRTLDKVATRKSGLADDAGLKRLKRKLRRRYKKIVSRIGHDSKKSRAQLKEARALVLAAPLASVGLEVLRRGLAGSRELGRQDFEIAHGTRSADDFHEWRKRAKDMWYQLRVMEAIDSAPKRDSMRELNRLSKLLGADHDLAMLQEAANGAKRDCTAILPIIAERRRGLQTEALALGKRLYEKT